MKHLLRFLKAAPKHLVAVVFGTLLAMLIIPFATLNAATVKLEGSLGIANVTRGDTRYEESVSASYDEVLKIQVYYHNMENPDSDKIARDLRVKLNVPNAPGRNQTITGTISSPDANTINDSVKVNLNRDDAYLEYIPGSAVWRHNAGTNENVQYVEEKISDEIVYGGTGVVLEDAKPCYNFEATVTILVRVRVPGVKIVKESSVKGSGADWSNNNTAKPGDTLVYLITYQNIGNTEQKNVVIRDSLPPSLTYVPGTTKLINSTNPNGVMLKSDNIINGGVVIGNYAPGAGAYVMFEVKVPAVEKLACGVTEYRNVGVVRPEGMNEYYNTSITKVERKCDNKVSYVCESVNVEQLGGRKVKVNVKPAFSGQGVTVKSVTINYGDGSTPKVTNNQKNGVFVDEYTYANDGTYNIVASVTFSVNGKDETVSSDACTKKVSFESEKPVTPTTPVESLPKTGAGSMIGIVAVVTAAGAALHNVLSRRALR